MKYRVYPYMHVLFCIGGKDLNLYLHLVNTFCKIIRYGLTCYIRLADHIMGI